MRKSLAWVLVLHQCGFGGDLNLSCHTRTLRRQIRSAILQARRGAPLLEVWIPTNTEVIRGERRPDTPGVPGLSRMWVEPDPKWLLFSPSVSWSTCAVSDLVSSGSSCSSVDDVTAVIEPLIAEVISNWLAGE